MAHSLINKEFYDAIIRFDESDEAKEYYYRVMNLETNRNGKPCTLREQILRVYSMLFCDDIGAQPEQIAGPEEVEATADRLHTGNMGYDRQHWYRMQYHFPIIDDDNYDRFAALVIADLNVGPLHEAAVNGGDMLLVGEMDPLHMTRLEREHQKVRMIDAREASL